MSLMSTLMYTIMALPVILVVLALLLKRRQSSYPSWRDVDPAVLKVGGSAKKLEAAADADVIVIGSGLGGLTSAAVLSKAGFKVVVLEQHDVIGGATHTFEDGGFEFDVGIHYLGGEMDTWLSPVRRLWAAVSDNKLEWTYCDPNFDVCHNASSGESIPFCGKAADNEARIAAAESLKGTRPGAVAAALRAYRRAETLAHLAGAAMVAFKALPPAALRLAWPLLAPLWRKHGCATVAEVCAACGMSGELASLTGVVSYLYGDYGVNPVGSVVLLHAHTAPRLGPTLLPQSHSSLWPCCLQSNLWSCRLHSSLWPCGLHRGPWPCRLPSHGLCMLTLPVFRAQASTPHARRCSFTPWSRRTTTAAPSSPLAAPRAPPPARSLARMRTHNLTREERAPKCS